MLTIMEKENHSGHRKRLFWINDKIDKGEWLDVGCGTGAMLTIPLILFGKNVYGMDRAQISITEAQKIAVSYGIPADRFICCGIEDITTKYDGVIVSEVLEHIGNEEQTAFVDKICSLVKEDGKLIITVPNGNGAYERSQRHRKMRDKIVKWGGVVKKLIGVKKKRLGAGNNVSMTLSDSKHVQFFSKQNIIDIFETRGFVLKAFGGSRLFAGIFTFLFPNIQCVMRFNNYLGDLFPLLASGYYFMFSKNTNGKE